MNATLMTRRAIAALLGGAAVAVVVWLVLVPWDLSEIDASGAARGGADDNAGGIAMVAVVLLAVGLVFALLRQSGSAAALFTFGGFITWAALFGWRAGSARVNGANLFAIPLLFAVIPTTVIVPLFVHWVARRGAVAGPIRDGNGR